MSIKDRIVSNNIARGAYKIKFYIDVGVSQVSWVTGKLPELMAVVFLSGKFGYDPTQSQIVGIVITMLCVLVLFGYTWKKLGLYDTERHVTAEKDPVQSELLEAARLIKANFQHPPFTCDATFTLHDRGIRCVLSKGHAEDHYYSGAVGVASWKKDHIINKGNLPEQQVCTRTVKEQSSSYPCVSSSRAFLKRSRRPQPSSKQRSRRKS
jgi:hypothetical protein